MKYPREEIAGRPKLTLSQIRRAYAELTRGLPFDSKEVGLSYNFFRIGVRLAQRGRVSRPDRRWARSCWQ